MSDDSTLEPARPAESECDMDASKRILQLQRQADSLQRRATSATLRAGPKAIRAAVFGERPRMPQGEYNRRLRRLTGKTPAAPAGDVGGGRGQLTENLTENNRKGR